MRETKKSHDSFQLCLDPAIPNHVSQWRAYLETFIILVNLEQYGKLVLDIGDEFDANTINDDDDDAHEDEICTSLSGCLQYANY